MSGAARVGIFLLALAGLGGWSAMTFLDRLIFQPGLGRARTPVETDAEDVFLRTEDGVRIHAYWLAGEEDDRPADRAILFLHGNGGDATRRLPNAARLRDLGAHVLLLDYRGYGKSDGRPDEAGVYADARAALDHLTKDRGLPEDRIVVFGRSLGGAVAIDVVRDRGFAGLVVESTFPSIAAIARSYLGVGLDFWLGTKFASIDKVASIRCPSLVFHGSRDRVIRVALGRRLFDALPEPKRWFEIAGAKHNDTIHVGGDAYWTAWQEFLERTVPRRNPA